MTRPRRAPRLKRLRKTVQKWNMLYGLLVQALDTLAARVLRVEEYRFHDEKTVSAALDDECTALLDCAG